MPSEGRHLRDGGFSPSSSKFRRPRGSARFPFGFRQKISVRRNFLPEKRSESAGTDVRGIQKAKTATDVVHVRQGKRKRIVQEPLFMPGYGMKRGSGCGEGSPAPSALHVRVVLPISTSAGIASFPTADHPVTFLSSSSKSTPPYKLHESPGTLPVSNPISAPSATSRIAVLISYP